MTVSPDIDEVRTVREALAIIVEPQPVPLPWTVDGEYIIDAEKYAIAVMVRPAKRINRNVSGAIVAIVNAAPSLLARIESAERGRDVAIENRDALTAEFLKLTTAYPPPMGEGDPLTRVSIAEYIIARIESLERENARLETVRRDAIALADDLDVWAPMRSEVYLALRKSLAAVEDSDAD